MAVSEFFVFCLGDLLRHRRELTTSAPWCEILEFVGSHDNEALPVKGNDGFVSMFILEARRFFCMPVVNNDDSREPHTQVLFKKFGHVHLPFGRDTGLTLTPYKS